MQMIKIFLVYKLHVHIDIWDTYSGISSELCPFLHFFSLFITLGIMGEFSLNRLTRWTLACIRCWLSWSLTDNTSRAWGTGFSTTLCRPWSAICWQALSWSCTLLMSTTMSTGTSFMYTKEKQRKKSNVTKYLRGTFIFIHDSHLQCNVTMQDEISMKKFSKKSFQYINNSYMCVVVIACK